MASRQEAAIRILHQDRAAKFNHKLIQAAKKESRKPVEKYDNPVLAATGQELHDERVFECACLLSTSTKPKHVRQASELFEQLIKKDFRSADCRRRWGLLLFLEGRYRAAAQQFGFPGLPPSTEPLVEDIWAEEIREWSLDLEIKDREQQIADYKTKLKAEFDPKSLIQARTLHLKGDDKASLEFAVLLSCSATKQHQDQALSLLEDLANKGYRKGVCEARLGVLHLLADRVELARAYLLSGQSGLQDDPFKPEALLALEWTHGRLEQLARSDPKHMAERVAQERKAEDERRRRDEERKLRDDQRLQIQKEQFEKTELVRLAALGKSQDEIKQLHLRAEQNELEGRASKNKEEITKLQFDEDRRSEQLRDEDLRDVNKAVLAAGRLHAARLALPPPLVAKNVVREIEENMVRAKSILDRAKEDLQQRRTFDARLEPHERAARDAQVKLARLRARTTESFTASANLLTMEDLIENVTQATLAFVHAQQELNACAVSPEFAEKLAHLQAVEADYRERLEYFSTEQLEYIHLGVRASERAMAAQRKAHTAADVAAQYAEAAQEFLHEVESAVGEEVVAAYAKANQVEIPRSSQEGIETVSAVEEAEDLKRGEEILLRNQHIEPGDSVQVQYTDGQFHLAVVRALSSKSQYLVWFPDLNVEAEVLASQLKEGSLKKAEDVEAASHALKLTTGAVFLKHGHFGKPHNRFVFVSSDLMQIAWGPSEAEARALGAHTEPCEFLSAVLSGRVSEVFSKSSDKRSLLSPKKKPITPPTTEEDGKDARSFSLVFGNESKSPRSSSKSGSETRTLDLEVVGSSADRDGWIQSFSWLLKKRVIKSEQDVPGVESRRRSSTIQRSPSALRRFL